MRRTIALAAAAALLALPAAAPGATRVLAVGDSITFGGEPFDNGGGYPARLKNRLEQGGLEDVEVANFGVPGDTSVGALSRVDFVLDTGGDIFVLLIGTNDVNLILNGQLTFEDTLGNIRSMLARAESRDMRSIVGTVPPRRPDARQDRTNTFTYEMVLQIRDLAARSRRQLADFWDVLPPTPETFADLYYTGSDPVGHPNAEGFDLMARTAAGVILPGDAQPPVEGRLLRPTEVTEIAPDETIELEIYDFGEGIDRANTTLTVNGKPIATRITGNPNRSVLIHEDEEIVDCAANIGIRAADLADPPNLKDRAVRSFRITGRNLLIGDLDFDCRVDGADLVAFARAFGAMPGDARYVAAFDFNSDGVIDGDDLARLATNFGRASAT